MPVLQQDLLQCILRLVSDRHTIRHALAASRALREATAQLIETLVSTDDPLPAHMWDFFPNATGLIIRATDLGPDYIFYLADLLATLPPRVDAIDASGFPESQNPDDSVIFAQALAESACSSNIRSLHAISVRVTPKAADIIVQALPALQDLCLHMASGSGPPWWGPKPGCCKELERLCVSSSHPSVMMDLSSLSAATKLQHLEFFNMQLRNLTALQALTNLQHLKALRTPCNATAWAALATLSKLQTVEVQSLELGIAAPASGVTRLMLCHELYLLYDPDQLLGCLARQLPQLQQMYLGVAGGTELMVKVLVIALYGHQQLRELEAGCLECSADTWLALRNGLPRLELLGVDSLSIGAASPAAAALHTLRCDRRLALQHTWEQLPGCLAQQLPQLRTATVGATDLRALAVALVGHQQLQRLEATHNVQLARPDLSMDVLAMLSDCSRLQEVSLGVRQLEGAGDEAELLTGPGLQMMAAGACRESLAVVELRTGAVELECVAALLQAGLPALREVSFGQEAGAADEEDSAAVQQRVEQVLPAGGMWEVEVEEMYSCEEQAPWQCRVVRRAAR